METELSFSGEADPLGLYFEFGKGDWKGDGKRGESCMIRVPINIGCHVYRYAGDVQLMSVRPAM